MSGRREGNKTSMIKAGVVVSAALLSLGASSGCAYTSYKNLNARSVTSPIEPESARMSALFCSEYAAERSRRERNYRSISDTGFVVGAIGLGTALGTGLATGPVKDESADRALKVVALSSLALWATAWSLWGIHGLRADTAATEAGLVGQHAVEIHERAEQVAARRADLQKAEAEFEQAQEELDDAKQRLQKQRDSQCCVDAEATATAVCLQDARTVVSEAEKALNDARTRMDNVKKGLADLQRSLALASQPCFDLKVTTEKAQPPETQPSRDSSGTQTSEATGK